MANFEHSAKVCPLQRRLLGVAAGCLAGLTGGLALRSPALAQSLPLAASPAPAPRARCPEQLNDLIALMLPNLPSYANRVNQRAFDLDRNPNLPGYVLLAGRPEFMPLSLGPGEYLPVAESQPDQVFFTTLERQYVDGKAVELQVHHWLFLTRIESGWRLVMLFSALRSDAADPVAAPPQDSSQGAIAQAIRLWLRDCQAGSIYPSGLPSS